MGVVDWGRVYATVAFPVEGNRSVLVGWTYVRHYPVIILESHMI